jgi:2,4-dienoyl-CoA reductase-like NADH-dependent reductase (Old Yellow Enzyme family)
MNANLRNKVLVTGANGFVGSHIVQELCSENGDRLIASFMSARYSHVIAIDICPVEDMMRRHKYSNKILPVEWNLTEIVDEGSSAAASFRFLLRDVGCVIHAAGVVDTRENEATLQLLSLVNVKLTEALIKYANECNVPRFVHFSSASAYLQHTKNAIAVPAKLPWYVSLLTNSMMSNMSISSYGKSKLDSERAVLRSYTSTQTSDREAHINNNINNSCSCGNSSPTAVVVLRPHVVWGTGDPLATDRLLHFRASWWSCWLPQFVLGDCHTRVLSVHVRRLARYALLADVALGPCLRPFDGPDAVVDQSYQSYPSPSSSSTGLDADADADADPATSPFSSRTKGIAGRVLEIGDACQTLAELHQQILRTNGTGRPDLQDRQEDEQLETGSSSLSSSRGRHCSMVSLPTWLSTLLVAVAQTVDWACGYRLRWPLLRLLTANNLAYTTANLLTTFPNFGKHLLDCSDLFEAAMYQANAGPRDAPVASADVARSFSGSTASLYQQWLCERLVGNWDQYKKQLVLLSGTLSAAGKRLIEGESSVAVSVEDDVAATVGPPPPANATYAAVRRHSVSQPLQLGPITLRNRVIKAATFECMCHDGSDTAGGSGRGAGVPTEELVAFHTAVARGGAGMTVVAYASVSQDGRSFPTQLCFGSTRDLLPLGSASDTACGAFGAGMGGRGSGGVLRKEQVNAQVLLDEERVAQETAAMLRRLCLQVQAEGCRACIQLTHAGAFADARVNHGAPPRGPSALLNPLTLQYSTSLDGDEATQQRIVDDFERAVRTCREIGFDAVELHLGHGYLLSQFLSRRTNPRHDVHARLRFPLAVLRAAVAAAKGTGGEREAGAQAVAADLLSVVPPKEQQEQVEGRERSLAPMAVLVKFNVSELCDADLPVSDVRVFAQAFLAAGADLLVPSGGQVMVNGLHMLRGGAPVVEMAAAQQSPFKAWVLRVLGRWLVPAEPFREAFFLQRTVSMCLGAGIPLSRVCLIGGVQDLSTLLRACGGIQRQGQGQSEGQERGQGQGKGQEVCGEGEEKGYGFAAVQMGRVLLADPNFCVKTGIAVEPRSPGSGVLGLGEAAGVGDSPAPATAAAPPVQIPAPVPVPVPVPVPAVVPVDRHGLSLKGAEVLSCDNSNRCIVDATMALKPLRCHRHPAPYRTQEGLKEGGLENLTECQGPSTLAW